MISSTCTVNRCACVCLLTCTVFEFHELYRTSLQCHYQGLFAKPLPNLCQWRRALLLELAIGDLQQQKEDSVPLCPNHESIDWMCPWGGLIRALHLGILAAKSLVFWRVLWSFQTPEKNKTQICLALTNSLFVVMLPPHKCWQSVAHFKIIPRWKSLRYFLHVLLSELNRWNDSMILF